MRHHREQRPTPQRRRRPSWRPPREDLRVGEDAVEHEPGTLDERKEDRVPGVLLARAVDKNSKIEGRWRGLTNAKSMTRSPSFGMERRRRRCR